MRVLVLYHAGFTYTNAIAHYLQSIQRHSRNEIEFFNVDYEYDGGLNFSRYDALVINFCVSSLARDKPPSFINPLTAGLRRFTGPKVVGVQDEYDFTNAVKRLFQRMEVNAILTNVPQKEVRTIYPEPAFNDVHFETVQTAYLSEDLLTLPEPLLPLVERPITLGYRGRILPYRLGDAGWHKAEIGKQFRSACLMKGIPCDIEWEEERRFAGEDWLRFVRRCRVMLGTSSGANVFDFDGNLHRSMLALYKANPCLTYQEVQDEIRGYEIGFDMGQVSARIFEAAASKTALALLRGSYSGVLEPEEHYVPIEPDYSNIDQVLSRILDLDAMQVMANRTYDHVVNNQTHRYASMVARLDDLIDELVKRRPLVRSSIGDPEKLRVSSTPLGTDPYLFEKICELRQALNRTTDQMMHYLKLFAAGVLEVVAHPDGTYRLLRTDQVNQDLWQ